MLIKILMSYNYMFQCTFDTVDGDMANKKRLNLNEILVEVNINTYIF